MNSDDRQILNKITIPFAQNITRHIYRYVQGAFEEVVVLSDLAEDQESASVSLTSARFLRVSVRQAAWRAA